MTPGVDLTSGPHVPTPATGADQGHLRVKLLSLLKLAVIGGLTFAVGFLGMVALRSLGLAAGAASLVSGAVVSISFAIAWYGHKIHVWREVIEQLYSA